MVRCDGTERGGGCFMVVAGWGRATKLERGAEHMGLEETWRNEDDECVWKGGRLKGFGKREYFNLG